VIPRHWGGEWMKQPVRTSNNPQLRAHRRRGSRLSTAPDGSDRLTSGRYPGLRAENMLYGVTSRTLGAAVLSAA
jgi:hypothetical protein